MYYEIYLDEVFLTNLCMDYLLLRLTGRLLNCQAGRRRSLAGAAAGALMSCLFLCLPAGGRTLPAAILYQGLTALLAVKLGCRAASGGMLAKAVLALYFTAFLCGGFWEAVTAGGGADLQIFFILAGCSYLLLTCVSIGCDYVRIRRQQIYPVTLGWRGKKLSLYALYDTGNLLTDAASGRAVSVIGRESLKRLLPEKLWEELVCLLEGGKCPEAVKTAKLRPHFLPYRSVGEDGILLAVTLEELWIHTPKEAVYVEKPVLAVAGASSALGGEYQMVLNFELLAGKK